MCCSRKGLTPKALALRYRCQACVSVCVCLCATHMVHLNLAACTRWDQMCEKLVKV